MKLQSVVSWLVSNKQPVWQKRTIFYLLQKETYAYHRFVSETKRQRQEGWTPSLFPGKCHSSVEGVFPLEDDSAKTLMSLITHVSDHILTAAGYEPPADSVTSDCDDGQVYSCFCAVEPVLCWCCEVWGCFSITAVAGCIMKLESKRNQCYKQPVFEVCFSPSNHIVLKVLVLHTGDWIVVVTIGVSYTNSLCRLF